jgi:hypothetical protein
MRNFDFLRKRGLTPLGFVSRNRQSLRFLGSARELGRVEKRKLEDLVLFEGNPLEDIHNTTKIDAVFANGREDHQIMSGRKAQVQA